MRTITGDIKALYAYYRLSDHVSTCINLKGKSLVEEVYFEGHMDMSFKNCDFNAPFYFGVEGARLAEDTREEDLFPPYGSNGISFDNCTINEPFEIADNCVATFYNCQILKASKIGNNCRVEFVGCNIVESLDFADFCDIRFRRCEFPTFDYKIKAENSCQIQLNDCTYTSYGTYFLSASGDCTITAANKEETPNITGSNELFIVEDNSVLTLQKFGELTSSTTAISASFSKIRAREISLLDGTTCAVSGDNSEIFLTGIQTISSTDTAIDVTNSVVRATGVDNIEGVQTAIKSTNSTISIDTFTKISSTSENCLDGTQSSYNISNGDTIEAANEAAFAIRVTGQSKSYISDIVTVVKGGAGAVNATDNAEITFDNIPLLQGTATHAVNLTNGVVCLNNVIKVEGKQKGIYGQGGFLRVITTADSIFGEGAEALDLTDTIYEIKDVLSIYSPTSSAVLFSNGSGIIRDVNTIKSDSGTVISGSLSDASSFTATNIGEITSQSGGLISISGDGKDSLVKFQNVTKFYTPSAPQNAIYIHGVYRIEFDGIEEITADDAGLYIMRLEGLAAGYGVIKLIDCKKIEAQTCRGGVIIQNALITDVVGVQESCSIKIGTGITFAFGVNNTNLFLKNYSEISVTDGDADAVYLYTRGLPSCEMKVLSVDKIAAKEGHGISLSNNGAIYLTDIARVEVDGDAAAIYGEGEGKYYLHGGHGLFTVVAKEEENNAIDITGQTDGASGHLELCRVQVEKGKLALNTITFISRGSYFRDFTGVSSGGHTYTTEFQVQDTFESTDSAIYFFDSLITGPGEGSCANSTLTFEVSTVNCTGTTFSGMNSSSILGNNSVFGCTAVTGFQATEFNACSGEADFDCQGVIINGCNFTGKITSSGYSSRAGLLINGSYLAEVIATQNTAIFLNGTHSLEDLTIGDTNAVYINWGYFSKETTIGKANSIISNYGVLRDITAGKGNILIASRTTVNAVTFDEDSAIIFNYCTPTSEGITLGDNSYLELNAVTSPYMPVILADKCAFVGNTTSVKSVVIPASSAALTTNLYTTEMQVNGDLICSGGAMDEYTGDGRMIATQRTALNNNCTPQDVSAGILVRDEGVRSQVLLWSEKTALQMGDNGNRTDARMYSLFGAARVVGPTAILHGALTGDAHCMVQGKYAERLAPQGSMLDQASGDATRSAKNVIDTASENATRTAADTIRDEATQEAIRKGKNILDDASVDATRKAGENLSDEAGGDAFRTAGGSIIDIADGDASRAAPNGTISDAASSISHDPPV